MRCIGSMTVFCAYACEEMEIEGERDDLGGRWELAGKTEVCVIGMVPGKVLQMILRRRTVGQAALWTEHRLRGRSF